MFKYVGGQGRIVNTTKIGEDVILHETEFRCFVFCFWGGTINIQSKYSNLDSDLKSAGV